MTGMEFHAELIQKSPEQAERTIFLTGSTASSCARWSTSACTSRRCRPEANPSERRRPADDVTGSMVPRRAALRILRIPTTGQER